MTTHIIKQIESIIGRFFITLNDHEMQEIKLSNYLRDIKVSPNLKVIKVMFNAPENSDKVVLDSLNECINKCQKAIEKDIKESEKVACLLVLDSLEESNHHASNNEINQTNHSSQSLSDHNKQHGKQKLKLENVKKIILVISGKGGVGKSTVATNVAFAMAKLGYEVGLLDADIYGPSIPRMSGLLNVEEPAIKNNMFLPIEKDGVKIMSCGFLIREDIATVWRGPMITKMLKQMLSSTMWEKKGLLSANKPLDYLIVDTPPGTGDVHLSLAENYDIDAAIVVSTPQAVAVTDAHKSVDMLRKLKIDIIGMVENMSYLESYESEKDSPQQIKIFGESCIGDYCKKQNINLITQIPLSPKIVRYCDDGISIFKNTKSKKEDIDLIERFFTIAKAII